jgi:protoporphyrinogen/coproporphyrinogen III oxidase
VAVTDGVVVGAGLAGLAAADRLARAGVHVTLLEAADRLGGNVHTTSFVGRPLDMGAEALVTREPAAMELCRELSLDGDLVMPASSRAHVWTRRGLRPLPAHAVTRVPGAPVELLRSRLLSPVGLLRCGWDVIAPSRAPDGDVAIGAIVRARLGREVLEQIVDPLLGGIHAGRCDTLSARALAPHFVRALGTGKGLVRGLRATDPTTAGAAFATLRGGMESLVAALAARTQDAGAGVRLGVSARMVHRLGSRRVIVAQSDGDEVEAAGCVVAIPAGAAAQVLRRAAPAAAAELGAIVHAPAAVVALAYPSEALAALPEGTGFVTAGDERLVRACTWSSAKWEHLRGDPAIVKAFVGRTGAPAPAVGDRDLATAVHRELAPALGLRHAPVDLRVHRFGAAIPQYAVGHLDRVERIEAALPPSVAVAGASYRGAGLSACVRSGWAAADRLLGRLGATHETARSHA